MSPIQVLEDPFYYYPPIYAWVFQVFLFPQVFPLMPCIHLSSPPYVPHVLLISVFLTWWALVNAIINAENFLIGWGPVSFSGRTLIHGIRWCEPTRTAVYQRSLPNTWPYSPQIVCWTKPLNAFRVDNEDLSGAIRDVSMFQRLFKTTKLVPT